MIDDLRALAIFAQVAESGSFSAAGRNLRLSTSVVSHHVKSLEGRLGVTLLYRSTRSLSLTSEGKRLLVDAQRMVNAAQDGLNGLADVSAEPAGALRLSAPGFLVNSAHENMIWRFAHKYPNIAITMVGSDKNVNLIAEGFDLAIRLGDLADSALMTQKLGSFDRFLVASPSYLDSRPPITSPDDLRHCDFVLTEMLKSNFTLHRGTEEVSIHPENSRILVNSINATRTAVLAGLGLQRLPSQEVHKDIADGKLVHVLPEWSLPKLNIFAVWPASGPRNSLVRLLLDFLKNGE